MFAFFAATILAVFGFFGGEPVQSPQVLPAVTSGMEYKLLATNKTSTMQKELNQAAGNGFRYDGVMGGETAFGGSETVVIMSRNPKENTDGQFEYRLLATKKTSTMQKELEEAGKNGFSFVGITVGNTAFGGREVVVILRR